MEAIEFGVRYYKKYQVLIIVLWIGGIIASAISPFYLRNLIDYVIRRGNNLGVIGSLGIMLILLEIFAGILGMYGEYLLEVLKRKCQKDAVILIHNNLVYRDYLEIENIDKGDIISRMLSDIEFFAAVSAALVPSLIINISRILVNMIVLYVLSPYLISLLLLMLPIILIVYKLRSSKIIASSREEREAFSNFTSRIKEFIDSLESSKRFSCEDFLLKIVENVSDSWLLKSKKLIFNIRKFITFYSLSTALMSISLLVVGSIFVMKGFLTVGTLIAFYKCSIYIDEPLTNLSATLSAISECVYPTKRILDLLKLNRDNYEGRKVSNKKIGRIRSIILENIVYEINDRQLLRNVNLTLESGHFYAIIGPSGAGKSTLVKVITGLYKPTKGKIKFNNVSISELNKDEIRRKIILIHQNDPLFTTSLMNNITLHLRHGNISRVIHLLEKFKLINLQHKLNKCVNVDFKLSDGERQRILILRSLLLSPDVLILDEALSGVDAETEGKILTILKKEFVEKGKMLVIISHRLSTVKNADLIFVLDKGKIVDIGKHQDLLNRCKTYREILHRQLITTEYSEIHKQLI